MNQHRTIVVADHHKSVFVCQALDRETGEVQRRSLDSRREVLEPFLRELPGPTLVFVEASRAWEWVSDLCEDLGLEMRLVDPSSPLSSIHQQDLAPRRDLGSPSRPGGIHRGSNDHPLTYGTPL